ncbi:MAG TPA: undecaprenyl-phosphate glucose phosphotransferase [Anaerolineae bacterium]|nr:undecaprenyl-phosphate glucose phosphotransferase [Anaerolineae bacterium]HIQ04883.1 undecaprenyl-phosphate glucose phosphotransferase [Anaerolineae bacterium]
MNRRFSLNYIVLLLFTDLLLTEIALHLASLARYHFQLGVRLEYRFVQLPPLVYVMVAAIWLVLFNLLSVYDPRKLVRLSEQVQAAVVAVSTATLVLAGALYLTYRDVPRLLFGYFFLFDLSLLLLSRLVLRAMWSLWQEGKHHVTRVLIIGAGRIGRKVARQATEYQWAGIRLVGFADDDPEKQGEAFEGLPVLGTLADAPNLVKEYDIDELIIALPLRAHERLVELVLRLQALPVTVRVVPDLFDLVFWRATVEDFGGIPLIGLRDSAIEGVPKIAKRVFDVVVASIALLILWPVMLLIALAIKLDSPGPAIFRQQRVGENGKLFWMYKFRSMVPDAEKLQPKVIRQTSDGILVHKVKDDPRITRVGRFLRRSSLDELPQLFNVLKGEMSLVGPRPELPWLVDQYEAWQRKRFAVPPGITGWWQINGRSERLMHLHTEDDLYYIRNYSLLLDLRILWRTIGVVLRGRGAY